MLEEPSLVTFEPESRSSLQSVLQMAIVVGKFASFAAVAFILVTLVSLIFNVFHLFHTLGVFSHLHELEASPGDLLYAWFIITCIGVFTVFVAVWWSIEPFCILRYLRQLNREEKYYAELYIPLKMGSVADSIGETSVGPEDPSQHQDLMAWARQEQSKHLLLLGSLGSGKTMFLHAYQGEVLQQRWRMLFGQQRIPVFASMEEFSRYLQVFFQGLLQEDSTFSPEASLIDFLSSNEDANRIRPISRYLKKLAGKGRILFLCDGLDMIDSAHLDFACGDLLQLVNSSDNRLIVTCREMDYAEQAAISRLVTATGGRVENAWIAPLLADQIPVFVRRHVEGQSTLWQHSADDILQVINRAHLIPLCTNPSALLTHMQIIDQAGGDGAHVLDTRGLMVQEYVLRRIGKGLEDELGNAGLTKDEVLRFLSEMAYVMYQVSDRNEIDFSFPLEEGAIDYELLAEEILDWVGAQPVQEPFAGPQDVQPGLFQDSLHKRKRAHLLHFARSIELIRVRSEGTLSFNHTLIADYFVAKHLSVLTEDHSWQTPLPLNEAFLSEEVVERWREPFALWAGLMADPAPLVERIALVGQGNQQYAAPALMLSLACLGTKLRQPQQSFSLPQSVQRMVMAAAENGNTRKKLARVLDRYAAENEDKEWVYRALLPLVSTRGIELLMVLLNKDIVPRMLFQYLQKNIDAVGFTSRKEFFIRILKQFGSRGCEDVLVKAAELSQAAPQRSLQLREAAIDILGCTTDKRAIKPLMLLLQDSQAEIVHAASYALAQLGPSLVLEPLMRELRNPRTHTHIPVLGILNQFLTTQYQEFQLKDVEYLRVLEALIPVLSKDYPQDAREYACEILIRLVQSPIDETGQQREKIVASLLQYLESQETELGNNVVRVLKEVGEFATPYLLDRLQHPLFSTGRQRIVKVFGLVRDQRALDALLRLVADPADEVFYQVKFALEQYVNHYPECIIRLIHLVLADISDTVADRAAEILGDLGGVVVEPTIQALSAIKEGRTEKLVHVLEKGGDKRAIPALINLLEMSRGRSALSLASTVIRTLGAFRDERVVPPLLAVLTDSDRELIDETIEVLSNLGEIAFKQLVAALEGQQETEVTSHIQTALIHMRSSVETNGFHVDEELFTIFSTGGDKLAEQIRFVFRERGVGAAQVLIQHIVDSNEQVHGRVLGMLYAMDRSDAIPAFVNALRRPRSELAPELFRAARDYLIQYDESIRSLVSVLRDPKSGAIADILLTFGPKLLQSKAMIVGLNDGETKERLQHIIKTLALRQPEVVPQIIDLFSFVKDRNSLAYTSVVGLLAEDLADQKTVVHSLIEALEKPEVVNGVADVLQHLAGRSETQDELIRGLIQALRSDTRRNGAKEALARLDDKVVYPVGDLIADDDQNVAFAAQEILTSIGPSAFPVIWSALSDVDARNPGRRDAGRKILCAMRTDVIRDKLVTLLSNEEAGDIEMAVTLLLELIQNEARRPAGNQKMISALLAFIQENNAEHTKLRILTLLLLWGRSDVAESLVQAQLQALRSSNPRLDEQLAQAFLLLRRETTGKMLQNVVQDNTGALPPALRAQLAGILGMIRPDLVGDYAIHIADYGLVDSNSGQVKNPNQLAVSLRALGALLVSGSWNIGALRRMREHADPETAKRELFDILLGDLYTPRIQVIQRQMKDETERREDQERENRRLQGELQSAGETIQKLSGDLLLERGTSAQTRQTLQQTRTERDEAKELARQWEIENQILKQRLASTISVSTQGPRPTLDLSGVDPSRYRQP